MNKTYNLVKEIIESWKYKVLEDDGEHIIIRYQMNVIHICLNEEDETFVSLLLPNFDEVTEENFAEVVMRCHKLNEKLKQIKLYTINDVIIAASEFFYMEKDDLAFQLKLALNNLIAAKVSYCNLDNK
jgi:hypothetical protein